VLLSLRHVSKAGETRQPTEGLQVSGAGRIITVTETADLNPNGPLDGVMNNSLMFYECEESVLPVVPVCEEYDLGYQIAQGGQQVRIYRNGETVQLLDKEGKLFTVPLDSGVSATEQWHECSSGTDLQWGLSVTECDLDTDMSTEVAEVHKWVQEAASSTSAPVDSSTSHQQATECCDLCTECQQL
jgi:hypothetical protein